MEKIPATADHSDFRIKFDGMLLKILSEIECVVVSNIPENGLFLFIGQVLSFVDFSFGQFDRIP